MDYHAIGFRECASEVARYMVTVEGLDLQDPLRLRLMAHLQCYAAQREMSLKSSASVTSWNPSAFTTPTHSMSTMSTSMPPPPPPPLDNDHHSWTSTFVHGHGHPHQLNHSGHNNQVNNSSNGNGNESTPASSTSSSTTMSSLTTMSNGQWYPGSSVKHYRPWGGTELAY